MLERLSSLQSDDYLSEIGIKITKSKQTGQYYATQRLEYLDENDQSTGKYTRRNFMKNTDIEHYLHLAEAREKAQKATNPAEAEQTLAFPAAGESSTKPEYRYIIRPHEKPESRQPELKTPAETLKIFSETMQRAYIDDLIHRPVNLLRHEGLSPRISESDCGHIDIRSNEHAADGLYRDNDPNSPSYGETIVNGIINVRASFAGKYSKQKVKGQPFEYSPSFTRQLLEEACAKGDIVPVAIDPYAQYGADLIKYRVSTEEEKSAHEEQANYESPQEALRRLAEAQGFQGNEIVQLIAEYQDSDQELSQNSPHTNHALVIERGKRDAVENQRLFDEYVKNNQSLLSGNGMKALIAHAIQLSPSASDKSETKAFKIAFHGAFDYSTFKAPYSLPNGVEGLNGARTHNGDDGWYSPNGPTALRKAMERSLELSSPSMDPYAIKSKIDSIIKPVMDAAQITWVTREYGKHQIGPMPQSDEELSRLLDTLDESHGYELEAKVAYRSLENARTIANGQRKHMGNTYERMQAKNQAKEYIQRFYEAMSNF